MIEELVKQVNRLQKQIDALVKPEVGRWLTFTPTVTQSVAVTATVNLARYKVREGICHLEIRLAITGAGVAGNNIIIGNLPSGAQIANNFFALSSIGTGVVYDAGVAVYSGITTDNSSASSMVIRYSSTNTPIGANPSFALANGDYITINADYEAT